MTILRESYADQIQPERATMLADLMSYHAPNEEKLQRFAALREVFTEVAVAVDTLCPAGADRTFAIRQLQEALMTANRSIANDGNSYR